MISYEEYKKDYFNGRSLAKALKNEMTEERFLLYYFMDCFAEDSDEVNENLGSRSFLVGLPSRA